MEKVAITTIEALQGNVLAITVVILAILICGVLWLMFRHIDRSDQRWSEAVQKNTDALEKMNETQAKNGDKIADKIERALIYRDVGKS